MDVRILAKKTNSQIIETHISWLLMGEFVYKIKKPLKLSFLDFSSAEKRKFCCEEEVRLNSRLSPEVYLGVVGIDEAHEFCEKEDGSEHAVKMKRLDEGSKMSRLLQNHEISPEQVRDLAGIIAAFHEKAERTPEYNSSELISSQIADLGSFRGTIEKAAGFGEWVDRLLKRSLEFVKKNGKLIAKRQENGFVRDCHGDLHAENIFFQDGIKIIDCIEFSREFRCIDIASDVAFLAMDLEYSGRDDLSEVFVSEYVRKTGDQELETILPLYKCYRANVRAKIAAIEWMQNKSHDARERIDRYVMLAERYSKSLN
jgi:hypothetical protein